MSLTIGITCNLRSEVDLPEGAPEDAGAEYDSETTLSAVSGALERLGHRVRWLGYGKSLLRALLDERLDLVFNFAEGVGGRSREAQVPAVLEMLGIPCTHSDPLTLAVTQDKAVAKRLVSTHGISTPRFRVVHRLSDLASLDLSFPLFAKPLFEGSSMGIGAHSRVDDPAQLASLVSRLLLAYREPVLVEEYCPGREFSVAILGTGESARALGTMGIEPLLVPVDRFIYSVEVKRGADWEQHVELPSPPRCAPALLAEVEQLALASYRALGCRDVGRVDVRLDARGVPCFLELNALPGLSPGWSDLCLIAQKAGLSHEAVIGEILASARERLKI